MKQILIRRKKRGKRKYHMKINFIGIKFVVYVEVPMEKRRLLANVI